MSKTERSCRCHGLSGACSVQTCYDVVPVIEEVSETLYSKYDGAVKVQVANGELTRDNDGFVADPLNATDLAYFDESPDLCTNATVDGVQGTAYRECEPSLRSPKSCSVLCCGRGYFTVTEPIEKEDCVFEFCCRLKCTTRVHEQTLYRCNP